MNLANKTTPWIAASLLAAASVFGQNQNQGQNSSSCFKSPNVCKPQPKCGPLQAPGDPTVCAYNAPAEINVGMQGDYDFFLTGSFLYWQTGEDNMAIGMINNNNMNQLLPGASAAVVSGFNGNMIEMAFDYKPGFKVGLGMNFQNDDWVGFAEYTRVHGSHSVSSNGAADPNKQAIFATWGHPFLLAAMGQVFDSAKANYAKNFDFADIAMWRHYYVGKSLLFQSGFGARGAWIQDSLHVNYTNPATSTTYTGGSLAAPNGSASFPIGYVFAAPTVVDVYQRVHSWGVGPKAGVSLDWLLGEGIRFFGSSSADVLYTKYKVQDKTNVLPLAAFTNVLTDPNSFAAGQAVAFVTKDKVGAVRAHCDLEFGFGWGTYFDNNNWHLDLAASYGWQVFFDQNMFRKWSSDVIVAQGLSSNGNVYVQGLNVSARLDF